MSNTVNNFACSFNLQELYLKMTMLINRTTSDKTTMRADYKGSITFIIVELRSLTLYGQKVRSVVSIHDTNN